MQKAMPGIQKDSVNPHYRNSYVSLEKLMEIVMPVLHDNGFVLMQYPTNIGYAGTSPIPALRTVLLHEPTGDTLEDTMLLMLDKDNPQGQGSAITYARRYSLMSILGLVADEDDDGESASSSTTNEGSGW